MKKLTAILLLIAVLLISATAFADCGINFNGEALSYEKEADRPFIESDRMFLSMDALFSKMGFSPVYDASTQTIIAVKDNIYFAMQIGNKNYHINENVVTFDVAPKTSNDVIYLPIRVILEQAGYNVDFDDATKTAIVTTK